MLYKFELFLSMHSKRATGCIGVNWSPADVEREKDAEDCAHARVAISQSADFTS